MLREQQCSLRVSESSRQPREKAACPDMPGIFQGQPQHSGGSRAIKGRAIKKCWSVSLPKALGPSICMQTYLLFQTLEIHRDAAAFMFSCCVSSSFMGLFTLSLTRGMLTSGFLPCP